MIALLALSTGFYIAIGIEVILAVAAGLILAMQFKRFKQKAKKDNVSVSFETNGGTAVAMLYGKVGAKMDIGKTERKGFVFEGWYCDGEFTECADSTVFPKKNSIYYARWKQVDYNGYNAVIEQGYKTDILPTKEERAGAAVSGGNVNSLNMAQNEIFNNAILAAYDNGAAKPVQGIDENAIIINPGNPETLQEAYEALSREQKSFYNEIKEYALGKEGAKLTTAKSHEKIKIGSYAILKLRIKRNITVAIFMLENELLKKYRKEDRKDVAIKVKETEVPMYDLEALKTAKDMVDLSVEQMLKEKEEKELERKEKRRQNKS